MEMAGTADRHRTLEKNNAMAATSRAIQESTEQSDGVFLDFSHGVAAPRVHLWFDLESGNRRRGSVSLWKPISFLPPIGMPLVPHNSWDDLEWSCRHDDVTVTRHTFFVESGLVVANCGTARPDRFVADDDFFTAMAAAGWMQNDQRGLMWK
jgi:hypothetical protein